MTTYIIIGNGVAGNAAAESIRKHDKTGKIIIFSKEKYPFYYVPALPEFLAGEKALKGLIIHDIDWYQKNQIDLHLETDIAGIALAQKSVVTGKGERYQYDKLLLATGGTSFIPPIKGAELDGVLTLRTLGDAEKIKELAQRSRQAVLIGGGLLGLEAGNGLRKAGLKVSVVEFFPGCCLVRWMFPGPPCSSGRWRGWDLTSIWGPRPRRYGGMPGDFTWRWKGARAWG